MKNLWRNALILALACALAALSLGIVNELTADIIAQRLREELLQARRRVFVEAEEFEILSLPEEVLARVAEEYNVHILETLAAVGNGQQLGYIFRISTMGFAGRITIMVGVSSRDQRIVGVEVMEHEETPGLGSAITEPDFLDQFVAKPVGDPFRLGQDIQAVTGATVSSRAVLEACLGAVRLFEEVKE
ncbi:MAG TPA: RnfABCDGE type electron transport complex subunit G [Atribacteraceae bacterium]|nr:RnfABCDGE type electron transport complex subunit G [Atribacteraceae bacterium]